MNGAALLPLFALLAGCSRGAEREPGPVAARAGDFAAEVLALHNRERALVAVPALQWDESLAAAAAAYGPELARLGRLVHSPPASRPGQGENLWMGTHGAYRVDRMVGSWTGEKAIFRRGTFPNVSTSGRWQDVAHYTQMIWRGTTRLGCALQEAPQWDYLICRYAPAGNVVGEPVP